MELMVSGSFTLGYSTRVLYRVASCGALRERTVQSESKLRRVIVRDVVIEPQNLARG